MTVSPVCRTAFPHEPEEQVFLQAAEEQRAFWAEQVDDEVALVPAYVVAEAVSDGNICRDTNRGHRNGKPNFPWHKSNFLSNTNLHTSNSFVWDDSSDNAGYHTNRYNRESVEEFPEYNIHTVQIGGVKESVVVSGLSPYADDR